MAYEFIECEQTTERIKTVWLNRPRSANALNVGILRELIDVSESLQDDTETRAVIFAGRGRHFSAGADLKAPAPASEPTLLQRRRSARFGRELMHAMRAIPQITIAAVHGAALGGGCCITTACDFRVGSTDAVCGYPEIDRGMNLQWQALPHCVQLIGPARAKRMVILGQHESATTLLAWGFFDEVVERGELMNASMRMAAGYAAKPPLPAQAIKRSVNAIAGPLDAAIMDMDIDQWLLTTQTADYREGIRAFLERRDPKFSGS